ncbi:MAG TPA: BON domain-containing protein [Candidatus Binataceae bacterium]|nr:BON domain-containing protein [Candidatus Binataceae bacterium]
MPMQARAQDSTTNSVENGASNAATSVENGASNAANSVESGTKEAYHGTKTEIKDTAITTKIKTALDTDPITKSTTIHVDTEHGIVTLSGNVSSMEISNQAQKIATATKHVKSVNNELKLQNASNPPNSSSGM